MQPARHYPEPTVGALHLFPDTVAALQEIGRTMKPAAPLAVTTLRWIQV